MNDVSNPTARTTFRARWFRGEAPVGEDAEVQVTPAGLVVRSATAAATWPYDALRQRERPRHGEPVRLARADTAEMIVCADHDLLRVLRAAAPEAAARVRASHAPPVVAIVLIGGAVAVALALWLGIPAGARLLSGGVPPAWEERFGAAVIEQAAPAAKRIEDPRVTAPLAQLLDRLVAARDGGTYTYRLTVVDAPEVNAFAAPGGHLAIHRGLLEFAQSPEEVAGVLAHEIAHVEERHVTQALLQKASLGVLVAIAFGDAGGPAVELARALGELSYSREAELEADARGFERMVAAGVDPDAIVGFLARMDPAEGGAPATIEFLSTHPAAEQRVRRLRDRLGTVERREWTPALAAEEWQALRAALNARGGPPPAGGAPR
jgi:beta-barrel assembly-enhancing protease